MCVVGKLSSQLQCIYAHCAHERPYSPYAYVFVWCCFLRIYPDDYFADGGRSNDALPVLFVVDFPARILRRYVCTPFGQSVTRCEGSGMCVVCKVWFCISFNFATLRSGTALLTICLCFWWLFCVCVFHEDCLRVGIMSNDTSLTLIFV